MKRCWAAACLLAGCGGEPERGPEEAAVPVKVVAVVQRDVPDTLQSVGQTRGSVEVEVRARVEGFVDAVRFAEGGPVRKGDLLYEIDPKPYTAALNRARGDLASAKADHARATRDVARYKPLVEQNAVSREDYETAQALEEAARAKVEAARAVVESAELDLSYTKVTSPIDGWAGKTEVKPGALVGRGQSTLLTTLSTNDPMHCRFSLGERDYLALARRVQADGRRSTEFELILSDGTTHPHRGRFVFIERQIDPSTGAILVEAAFPNPEGILRPGLFARVKFPISVRKNALLVPQRAISELQATYSVGVVNAENVVEIRPVKVGPRIGALRVVEGGLAPGERVIVDGLQKVKAGTKVLPTPAEPVEDAPAEAPEQEVK